MSDPKDRALADLDWDSALDEWQERSDKKRDSDVAPLLPQAAITPKSLSAGALGLKAMFDGALDDTPAERASPAWTDAFRLLRDGDESINVVDHHVFEEALAALAHSDVKEPGNVAVRSELHRILGDVSRGRAVLDEVPADWILSWQQSRLSNATSDKSHLTRLREEATLAPSGRLALSLHLQAFELARSLGQSGEIDIKNALVQHSASAVMQELGMAFGVVPDRASSKMTAGLPAAVRTYAQVAAGAFAGDWLAVVNELAELSSHVGVGAALLGNALGRAASIGSRPFVSEEPSGAWDRLLQAVDERDSGGLSECAVRFREIDSELSDVLTLLAGKKVDIVDRAFQASNFAVWGDVASSTDGQAIAAEFIDGAPSIETEAPLEVERALRIGSGEDATAAFHRWACTLVGEDVALGVIMASQLVRNGRQGAALTLLSHAAERTPDHGAVLELLRQLVPNIDYINFLQAASEVSAKAAASHFQLEAAGLAAVDDRLPFLVSANVGLEFVTALVRQSSGSNDGWAALWTTATGDKAELRWAELVALLESEKDGGLPLTRSAAALEHERLADVAPPADKDALLLAAASAYLDDAQTDEALRALGATSTKSNAFRRVLHETAEAQLSVVATATDELLDALKLSATSDDRNETRERLAWLDEMVRGDSVSALYNHLAIVEEDPSNRASLRRIARSEVEIPTWGNALTELALLIDEKCPEAAGHAELAAHPWSPRADRDALSEVLCTRISSLRGARAVSLRSLALGAIDRHHLPDAERRVQALLERLPDARGFYAETLALLSFVHDDFERATRWSADAVAAEPERVLARLVLPLATFAQGDASKALDQIDELIETLPTQSSVSLRVSLLTRAIAFADMADRDPLKWLMSLVLTNPSDLESFRRADRLARAPGNGIARTSILAARAEVATGDERSALEIELAEVFLESGDADSALTIVESALAARPDEPRVLALAARIFRAADESAREEATLLRLVRRAPDEKEQVEIFSRLATLYTHHTVNLSRAEAASKEVLRRRPNDRDALELLVTIYRLQNDGDRAVSVQERRITIALADEARDLTFELAEIFETVCHKPAKAEGVLEKQREMQPLDVGVLTRLASLLERTGQAQARAFVLERSVVEARRALEKGDDPIRCINAIDKCYELSGKQRIVTQGFLEAFQGHVTRTEAALTQLGHLDAFRPEDLSPAVVAYFSKIGNILDQAAGGDAGRDATGIDSQSAMAAQAARCLKLEMRFATTASSHRRVFALTTQRLLSSDASFQQVSPKARTFLMIAAMCHVAFGTSIMTRLDHTEAALLIEASILRVNPTAFFDESADRSQRAAQLTGNFDDAELPLQALEMLGTFRHDWRKLISLFDRWACTGAWLAMGCDSAAALEAFAWRASLPPEEVVKTDDFRLWLLHALR